MGKARPGERAIAARPMHFFWIVDCSGSMMIDGKMQSLNNAIDESIPAMRDVAEENPFAEILVRTVRFSSGAQWQDSQPTAVADFKWTNLDAEGVTDMGAAFELVAEQLAVDKMGERGYPPVLVLLSDGQPTDDWKKGLDKLLNTPWGKRASRIAIAIGNDADHEPLQAFINNIEFPVLQANNPQRLVTLIRWASSAVSKAASAPASKKAEAPGEESGAQATPPPPPPEDEDASADDDVW